MVQNEIQQQTDDHVRALPPLEHVRLRPGMYIGGVDIKALHHLAYEVVDNAIDEALAGRCDRITVILHEDNTVSVADNGGGIPVGMNKDKNRPTMEVVMTEIGAGAKFGTGAYKVSGGLHGVGVSAVNALSERMKTTVYREGYVWEQEYVQGRPVYDVRKARPMETDEATGTVQTFKPDFTIIERNDFSFEMMAHRFREMAFVTRKVTITLRDERVKPIPQEVTFYFEGGLKSFVRYMNRHRVPLHVAIGLERDMEVNVEGKDGKKPYTYTVGVEVALQYTDSANVTEIAFANTIHTPDGGTHLTGLRSAITSVVNRYARKINLLKEKDTNFSGTDVLEGMTAIVSVKHPAPSFESQTKVKLLNTDVQALVSQAVTEAFMDFLELNPKEGRRIVEKCMMSMRAREAARKARDLVRSGPSLLESSTLPGKLADCSRHGANSEIYIVEGDSAGGCFSGDTLVALADGRHISFAQLVEEQAAGQEHFGYTMRPDNTIGVERLIHARVTKQNAGVIRLTLDNGETIVCTPDHRFMLRDGTYKPAVELTSDDSLMPLYRKLSDIKEPSITIDGYEMVWSPRSDTWLFTHLIADWYNRWQGIYGRESGDHCHHIDFNKRNNNPSNLVRLSKEDHLQLHRQHVSKTLHRDDVIEKGRLLRQSDSFRSAMSTRMQEPQTRAILSEQAKAQWADATYKSHMIERWQEFYTSNPTYQEENAERLNQAQQDYWASPEHRAMQADRVREFFAANPDARKSASEKAISQWQDQGLLNWRRETTSQQWTDEFRESRKEALKKTYYTKTMAALKKIQITAGSVDLDAYQAYRLQTRDKSLLRFDSFSDRYFEGNQAKAVEAVQNYNHRIVKIEHVQERIDVYDVEVPHTHNFALASGVFVHNSAKQGRDRHFQAILPLRGKILNTERARLDKMLDNNEIKALISALGTGIHEDFTIEKIRYERVIIMTDADTDGSHIRTLLLTFFYRHMTSIVTSGHLFIAQPPIYLLKAGKDQRYVYPTAGMTDGQLLEKGLRDFKDPSKVGVQRYKGLGEMNPEQLWETTMNPEHRTLLKVTVDDAAEADSVFDMLMGSSVPPRRRFIQTNAKLVKNLDI